MSAALAWSQYHRDSVVFVFGAEVEQRRKAMERDANREKILTYLRGKDWVVRSEIVAKGFGGRIAASAINDAVQAMLSDGEIEQDHRAKDGAVRGHKTFCRLSRAKGAKDANTSTAAKDAKDSVDTESDACEKRAKDAAIGRLPGGRLMIGRPDPARLSPSLARLSQAANPRGCSSFAFLASFAHRTRARLSQTSRERRRGGCRR